MKRAASASDDKEKCDSGREDDVADRMGNVNGIRADRGYREEKS